MTTTSPPLPLQWLRYARCLVRALWLPYEIHETRAYLRACSRDGLVHSLHLDEWRRRLGGMEAELVAVRCQIHRGLTPWLL